MQFTRIISKRTQLSITLQFLLQLVWAQPAKYFATVNRQRWIYTLNKDEKKKKYFVCTTATATAMKTKRNGKRMVNVKYDNFYSNFNDQKYLLTLHYSNKIWKWFDANRSGKQKIYIFFLQANRFSACSHVYVVCVYTRTLDLLRRLLIRYCFHESVCQASEAQMNSLPESKKYKQKKLMYSLDSMTEFFFAFIRSLLSSAIVTCMHTVKQWFPSKTK